LRHQVRAIARRPWSVAIGDRLQKRDELGFIHLAGAHCKLAVVDTAQTADMPVDCDVIGRIGKVTRLADAFPKFARCTGAIVGDDFSR
jgi:hypothetical protein